MKEEPASEQAAAPGAADAIIVIIAILFDLYIHNYDLTDNYNSNYD